MIHAEPTTVRVWDDRLDGTDAGHHWSITIERWRRGWLINGGMKSLNRRGQWIPAYRGRALNNPVGGLVTFYADLGDAIERAKKALPTLTLNNLTTEQVVELQRQRAEGEAEMRREVARDVVLSLAKAWGVEP